MPIHADFIYHPSSIWIRQISSTQYNLLWTSILSLTDCINQYKESLAPEQHSTTIQPSLKWIQQVLNHYILSQCPFAICNSLSKTCRGYSCRQPKSIILISWEPDFLVKIWQQIWNWTGKRSLKIMFLFHSHAFLATPNFWANFFNN